MSCNPALKRRRGTTAVQVAVILGAIALVAIPSIATLGKATSEYLNDTAEGVADPSKLTEQFGEASGSGSDSGSADSGSGDNNGSDSGGAPASKKKKKSGRRK